MRRLREENKGTLLAYSVEADENEAAGGTRSPDKRVHKRMVQEMIRSIDVAAEFEDSQAREAPSSGRRTWVAIKVVSLIDDYLK
jgi:proline dehydrogenase